jgi:hypothetical protein
MVVKLGRIDSRPVVRETVDHYATRLDRHLMVKLDAGGRFLELWQKGRRTRYKVAYSTIFSQAVNAAMYLMERERRARKAEARKLRLKLRRA